MCVSSKASSEILPDIIVVSGVNHATSYLFYIWWSSQSRWFKVCRLAKESVEPTAYCLLPQSLTCYGLKCRTYWMSTTPSLLYAVPSATTFLTFYLLSGVKYLMWWASKLPSNSHRVWIAYSTLVGMWSPLPRTRKFAVNLYNFFFFENISILYSLSNHLSRKILNFFLKGGVTGRLVPTGLPSLGFPFF